MKMKVGEMGKLINCIEIEARFLVVIIIFTGKYQTSEYSVV